MLLSNLPGLVYPTNWNPASSIISITLVHASFQMVSFKLYLGGFGSMTWQILGTWDIILKDLLRFVSKLINTVPDVSYLQTLSLTQTCTHRTWQEDGKVTSKYTESILESGQRCSHSAFLIFSTSLQWNNVSLREAWENKKAWIKCSGSVGISPLVLCSSFTPSVSSLAFSCLVLLDVCVYLYVCVSAS